MYTGYVDTLFRTLTSVIGYDDYQDETQPAETDGGACSDTRQWVERGVVRGCWGTCTDGISWFTYRRRRSSGGDSWGGQQAENQEGRLT